LAWLASLLRSMGALLARGHFSRSFTVRVRGECGSSFWVKRRRYCFAPMPMNGAGVSVNTKTPHYGSDLLQCGLFVEALIRCPVWITFPKAGLQDRNRRGAQCIAKGIGSLAGSVLLAPGLSRSLRTCALGSGLPSPVNRPFTPSGLTRNAKPRMQTSAAIQGTQSTLRSA